MDEESKTQSLMVRYMHKQCQTSGWLRHHDCTDPSVLGVIMKLGKSQNAIHPPTLNSRTIEAFESINATIAFTMSSKITDALFCHMSPYQTEVSIQSLGIKLPIIDSFEQIVHLSKLGNITGSCYIIRGARVILVWSDSVQNLLPHGAELERLIVETMWGRNTGNESRHPGYFASSISSFTPQHYSHRSTANASLLDEHEAIILETEKKDEATDVVQEVYDPESGPMNRPMILTHSFMVGLGMMVLVTIQIGGVGKLIGEILTDGNYLRILYLLLIPLSSTFALFFATTLVACIFQLLGPVGDIKGNSRYHSAIAPNQARHRDIEYPHITIQIPVYKEGLKGVIIPTVISLKKAIKHYESVGGTASIFINEDGMQVISPELAKARQMYYKANNVGWCARPPHKKDGFLRKGQFKKASNMNYCLDFSIRVEDELMRMISHFEKQNPDVEVTVAKENELYSIAMEKIIASDEGRTMAGGNVRLGELILLVDCDTKVPVDCLQFGALEMLESPDVAIVQHASGVMQVVHNLFENAITYLTNLIYNSIQFAVGSGDLACFVGHNAFLRWKAVQSVAFQEDGMSKHISSYGTIPLDDDLLTLGLAKYWSDSHVSEDFDLALRLQINKFIIRLASYHNGGFKEGVSLTVFDELARWEKYTYGCNELLFNPFYKWITKGPFTPLLWKLIMSNVKSSSKVTVLGYVFTYYAMAAALPFTLINYFLTGWIPDSLDHYYLESFKIMILLLAVFNGLSPLAYNFMLHRLDKKNFFSGMWETIKWMPLFVVFFGGISIHLSKAILCHFFGVNMEWNSTAKELEATGFFIGIDKIIKDFKYMYVIVIMATGVLVYLGLFAPRGWIINDVTIVLPVANQICCHFLLPIALGLF